MNTRFFSLGFHGRCLAVLFCLLLCPCAADAQDYISFFRGDEVGPREFHLDEETFLNILSYEQPLESKQRWLAASQGYRLALGSLSGHDLWHEHEIKALAEVSERFKIRVMAHQGIDMDESHLFIQPVLEYGLDDHNALIAPVVLDGDKGNLGGGLGWCYRDRDAGIDYVQFAWLRSNIVFRRSREFEDSTVRSAHDTLEVQAQGSFLGLGHTSLKIAYLTHGEIRYEELGRDEEYRRFTAWLLHRYEIDELNRIFVEFDQDSAAEQIDPFDPGARSDEYRGERDLGRLRFEYQKDLDHDTVRRIRGGVQHVWFREDEHIPFDRKDTHKIDRSEFFLYAGYRCPLGESDTLSLESVAYVGSMNNHNHFPYDSHEDGTDPSFQGKAAFCLHWAMSEDLDFVVNPSFELDDLGWAGGGIQLRYYF